MIQRFLGIAFLIGIFIFFNQDFADDFRKAFKKKPTPAATSTEVVQTVERVEKPESISPAFAEYASWDAYKFTTERSQKLIGHFFDSENQVEILIAANSETKILSSSSCVASQETSVVKNNSNQLLFKQNVGQTALLIEPHWLISFVDTMDGDVPALRGEVYIFSQQKWSLKQRFLALKVNAAQPPAGLRCN